jgi:hypothetical protein
MVNRFSAARKPAMSPQRQAVAILRPFRRFRFPLSDEPGGRNFAQLI